MLKAITGEVRAEPLNDNFSYLADRLKNAKASVDNFESLPVEGNEVGDFRLTIEEGTIYYWDGEKWKQVNLDASVEVTSNDDGFCLRFANGFQICVSNPFEMNATEEYHGFYRSETAVSWVFPTPFIDENYYGTAETPLGNRWAKRTGIGDGTSMAIRQFAYTESSGDQPTIGFAFGRWK